MFHPEKPWPFQVILSTTEDLLHRKNLGPKSLGAEGDEAAALYNEQKDHKSMSSVSMQSGVSEAIEASEEAAALGQRLHGIATQRQQLQLAEVERRVWAKHGLLQEQTTELAALHQECEIAVAEPNAMGVQLDAERVLVQLEHLKGQECILDEGPEKENGAEEASVAKSLSKSKKSSVNRTVNEDPGDDLVFQVGHKVSYKTVLKAQHSLILKASNMVEKMEWIAKLRGCIKLPKDSSMKSGFVKESKSSSNIAAFPQVFQVAMCPQLTAKIEELVKEDQGVKAKLEQWQKQPAALSKLTQQLSLHDS
ncbi:unnamed protein product [Sphagnum jensenii]